ncbi:hypothetical protein QFZ78_001290 [Paenibacillus sp. V4I5]|nr:hypothetical protein [Paenibacillus sp. V4I5]
MKDLGCRFHYNLHNPKINSGILLFIDQKFVGIRTIHLMNQKKRNHLYLYASVKNIDYQELFHIC